MKTSLVHLSCAVALCLLSLSAVFGCAVITVTPLTEFDSSEYIFIGEVIGIADPITSEKFHGQAWGVKIRVKDYVNLPKSPVSHFVVLPFELESDCRDKGRSADELLRYFPVGSEGSRPLTFEVSSNGRRTNGRTRLAVSVLLSS